MTLLNKGGKLLLASMAFSIMLISCASQSGAYTTQIVSVDSENSVLVGRVYKPDGNGPFPAVVLVHGSKNHTMNSYAEYSQYFASHGVVTLSYDKRGQGMSTGSLYTSTFRDLAKDALSFVDLLTAQPYVDQDKVGLWADSQGGWIILIADSLSSDLAFLINKSGPATTPLEQIRYDYQNNYFMPNHTPMDVVHELSTWYENVFKYLTRTRSDSLWAEIKQVIDKFDSTRYLKAESDAYYLSILRPPTLMKPIDEVILGPAGRDYDFDPVPYLKRLKTPMIYFLGTDDAFNDTPACVEVVTSLHNPNIILKIYNAADHGLRIQRSPALLFKPTFPEGYLELQVKFMKASHK